MGAKKRKKKEQEARAAAVAAAKKTPEKKKSGKALLIAVIAVVCAAAITVGAVLIVRAVQNANGKTPAVYPTLEELMVYDYEGLDITKYHPYAKGSAAGVRVDMAAYYDEYVSRNDITHMTLDDHAVDEQIAYLLLQARTPAGVEAGESAKTKVNGVIGYGDDVSLFILSAVAENDEGETVPAGDFFVNAYESSNSITIGAYTFGEAFDLALCGKNPADTRYSENAETDIADITDGDIVRLYYTATVDGAKTAAKSAAGVRLPASDPLVKRFREESAGLRTGETVTFHMTEDIDEDGEDDDVVYVGYIVSVMTEVPLTVTAMLPDDYFPERGYEEYLWLNGKEITYSVILTSYTDYDAKETAALTRSDIVDLLGYKDLKAGEDDEEGAIAEYRAYIRADLEKQIADARDSYEEQAMYRTLIEEFPATDYPDEAALLIRRYLIENVMSAFNYYSQYYYDFPFASAEDFAPEFYGYDVEEYPTLDEYVASAVEDEVGGNLLVHAVFRAEELTLSDEELQDARQKWIDEQLEGYLEQNGTSATEAQLMAYYGEENVKYLSRQMLISEKVAAFLKSAVVFDYGEN